MIDSELRVNVCRFVRKTFYTFYIQTAKIETRVQKELPQTFEIRVSRYFLREPAFFRKSSFVYTLLIQIIRGFLFV